MSQQGIPLGRHLRPRAAWYGKMSLVPHIGGIVRTGAVDVAVTWGEPVAYDAATDRKELARTLETAIRSLTVAALREAPRAEPSPAERSGRSHSARKGAKTGQSAAPVMHDFRQDNGIA